MVTVAFMIFARVQFTAWQALASPCLVPCVGRLDSTPPSKPDKLLEPLAGALSIDSGASSLVWGSRVFRHETPAMVGLPFINP